MLKGKIEAGKNGLCLSPEPFFLSIGATKMVNVTDVGCQNDILDAVSSVRRVID